MKRPRQPNLVREGDCTQPATCPLSRVQAGTVVCIKELCGTNAVTARLREMGFGEEQQVKLLSRAGSVICQVCNARLGLSAKLADSIIVQPLPHRLKAA